jgi:glycosyltransferase involved in cell wall biosynthesis
LKILHTICSVDPAGGGPIESINQLGLAQIAAGHEVEIAALDSPDAPYLKQSVLPVHALGPAVLGYAFSSRLVPWLRANRGRYDVVIVNGIWQFHSFGTWRALHDTDTPYVLFTHGMLDPWFKNEYPLKHLKKCMYWPWAEYRVLRDARSVIFTCEEERVLARTSFSKYSCNEAVVSLGLADSQDEPSFAKRELLRQFPEIAGKKIILFMGRIHPKKGCDLLIEAFAKVLGQQAEWQLVFAGPDQVGMKKQLEAGAEKLGVTERITWTGMIRGATKCGALRTAEAFILPSHQENFGIAVAEALAAGLPVLISNKVNIWREIQADGAGIVAEDSIDGTCELLQSYVEMAADDQRAMRERARACFEQRFEIQKAAQTLQVVLERATGTADTARSAGASFTSPFFPLPRGTGDAGISVSHDNGNN